LTDPDIEPDWLPIDDITPDGNTGTQIRCPPKDENAQPACWKVIYGKEGCSS